MTKSSNPLKLIFPFIVWLMLSASSVPAIPLIPLEKGASWIYEGKVDWQDGTTIKTKQIRWITQIIDVFDYPKMRVAVVRGLPTDLAWYTDNKPPGYALFIVTRTNAYYQEANSRDEAYRLARAFRRNPNKQLQEAGSFITDSSPKCKSASIAVKGFNPQGKVECVETTYRSNPDIAIFDFTYGLGIVRYYYEHFGTVSTVDVELKEIRTFQKNQK